MPAGLRDGDAPSFVGGKEFNQYIAVSTKLYTINFVNLLKGREWQIDLHVSFTVRMDLLAMGQCSSAAYMWKISGLSFSMSDLILNSLSPYMVVTLKPLFWYMFMTVCRPCSMLVVLRVLPDCTVRKFISDDFVCRKGKEFT